MLLGTAHLANRNRDVFNVQFDDMLAAGRQAEIRDCIDRLKRWNPTKVAMEVSTNRADVLDEEFRRYLAGTFNLTADEIHQLGFRIAAELGHEQLYAIDWNEPIGDGQGLDPVFAFAQAHQPEIYNQLIGGGQRELEQAQASVASTSVREMLCGANDPASLRHSHQPYLVMACVGEGKHYVGIDWVKGWYERNLKIFVNLTRIVASPRDRILVIYGAGHVPLLAQFIRDSGFYTLESVEPYLC
jgi:hypothetical protein